MRDQIAGTLPVSPHDLSKQIRKTQSGSEEGWGRLNSEITVKESTWQTSIWFDTKHNCFLVPIKAAIRKKEGIADGSEIKIKLNTIVQRALSLTFVP